MTVITRFAPSPTGFLHIGGARTALFNWLYAKHTGGKFLLRIEDTDRERSTDAAIRAILDGMKWLELDWDDKEIYQFSRAHHHAMIAHKLLQNDKAYKCYCSKEELEAEREKALREKRTVKYSGKCRKLHEKDAPKGVSPVIRLKAPLKGETYVEDVVQGTVTVKSELLDDMVLLRSDGTPTYMLAVVVDDHDMGVTHVIRGDDHLTNAIRQKLIYDAMGWETPIFAHIPLIHGDDGAKLSKRHGALGVEAYRDMGYLPEAMRNYLLRLGWSHGDDEIIPTEKAIEWFDIKQIGKSPARFDFKKLDNVNKHYLREKSDEDIIKLLNLNCDNAAKKRIERGIGALKERAATLKELKETVEFYISSPKSFTQKAQQDLNDEGKNIIRNVIDEINKITIWEHDNIEMAFKNFAERTNIKLGKIMAPLRAAITGSHASPSMFEVIDILGKDEVKTRLEKVL